ncbi:MAG: hypothetical protein WDZ58_01895 [Gemmatimonadaceae bacterium]
MNRSARTLAVMAVMATLAVSACAELPTETPGERDPGKRTLGLMEIALTGIGTSEMRASAALPEPAVGGAHRTLTPVAESGRSGIQLRALSSGTFTFGPRGVPGSFRHIFVTFQVRNASSGGVAYTTARQNLTFIAVSTSATISGTAVKEILKFDGSAASTSDAENWIPTGAPFLTIPQTISALSADVLQVFTEAEAASFGVPAGVSAFPYGFMARHATATDTRTLPANPAVDVYDGYVTFAFKVPLAEFQVDDPYSVKLMVMAVDDSETRVTQSVEERDAPSQAAFEAKVAALSATGVTLLTGGSYSGSVTARTLCGVRSSGTVAAPIAYVNGLC